MHPVIHAYCLFLIFFFLVVSPTALPADIYRWTDENGATHHSNVTISDSRAGKTKTFQFAPRPTPQRRSIPLKTRENDRSRKFVDVTFQSGRGTRNVPMLVDTGAQITVIAKALAAVCPYR